MIYEKILTAISTVGFPVFVAVYLMIFMEKTIKANTKALNHLSELIFIQIYGKKSKNGE